MVDNVHEAQQLHAPSHRGLDADFAMEVWHRRKWLAIVVFSATLTAVVFATRALPDLYRATATVFVASQQVSEAFVKPSVTTELETRIQTIHQQVMSRAGLADLIARLGLYPEFGGEVPEGVIERMRRDIQLELKSVAQSYSRSTIAFTLAYSGRDPKVVAEVVNTLAAVYVEQNTQSRAGQAARTAEFLKGQLAEVKQEVNLYEQRADEFRASHGAGLPEQILVNLAALERLYTKLRVNGEDQRRLLDRRERLEQQLAEADFGQDPTSSEPPVKTKLSTLTQQLAELRRQFTEEHPDVIRVKREIAALEEDAVQPKTNGHSAATGDVDPGDRARRLLDVVDAEFKPMKEEEAFLRQSIIGYEARIENAPRLQQELRQLSSDYEITKERYETLLKRYEEAALTDNLEQDHSVEQFRILDAAIPPRAPAAPRRPRLLILGLLASLALAFAAVVVVERLDTSFHSVDDLRASISVPTLATIRLIPTEAAARRRRRLLPTGVALLLIGLALIAAASQYVATENEQLLRLAARFGG